jgi:hypothetical protein
MASGDQAQAGAAPRLTLVLCSRNDQWQGNSLWRLETTLNYTAMQAAAIGRLDEVEIIVADWGSVDTLRDAAKLTPDAAKIVRYLNISPLLAKDKQKDSPFAEVYAINAAVRRSRGEYVGRIDQDTLVGKYFLQWFFVTIEATNAPFPIEKTAMISNRRRIPYDFALLCPSFPLVSKYLELFRWFLPRMYPPPRERYWECYIGILLFHRNLWEAAGGYDESFIYYGHMEFDFFLRLLKKFNGLDLSDTVRCDFYHLDHVPTWKVWHELRRSHNPVRTPDDPPPEFCPNGDSWGLADYEIPLSSAPKTAILEPVALQWQIRLMPRLFTVTILSTVQTFVRIVKVESRPQIKRMLGPKLIAFIRDLAGQRTHR